MPTAYGLSTPYNAAAMNVGVPGQVRRYLAPCTTDWTTPGLSKPGKGLSARNRRCAAPRSRSPSILH